MTARQPYPLELRGKSVLLRPQRLEDATGLYDALRDASVWTWLSLRAPESAAAMERIVEAALAERDRGVRWPWTVLALGDGGRTTIAGTTSYGDWDVVHDGIEIGWTSYGVPWQRTAVNTETKLLLLGHAFDDLGYERVFFKTDIRNERSQTAIARLGAVREGVLRHHRRRPDGTWRDSVYFSTVRDEWPAVRGSLHSRLARATDALAAEGAAR